MPIRSAPPDPGTQAAVLTVRLFARFAELVGEPELSIPSEGIRTVGDLLARLAGLPHGPLLTASALVAVNLVQARADTPLQPGDEIALLPPLAGG